MLFKFQSQIFFNIWDDRVLYKNNFWRREECLTNLKGFLEMSIDISFKVIFNTKNYTIFWFLA